MEHFTVLDYLKCFKPVLRNSAKFTGKHLYQSLFFNKVAGLSLRPNEKILYYAKLFNEKICKKLAKIWEKKKKHLKNFSTLLIDDMKTKKNTNLFYWYKNTQQ